MECSRKGFKHRKQKLIYVHLFTDLFCKACSLFKKTNIDSIFNNQHKYMWEREGVESVDEVALPPSDDTAATPIIYVPLPPAV